MGREGEVKERNGRRGQGCRATVSRLPGLVERRVEEGESGTVGDYGRGGKGEVSKTR